MADDMMECFVVLWEHGIIFKDRKEDRIWLGGSPSLVFAPVFPHKKQAQDFARKARRLLKAKGKQETIWVQRLEKL